MYLRAVTTTEQESLQNFAEFRGQPTGNLVLDTWCKFCVWPAYADRLSLKFTFAGHETYHLRQRTFTVHDDQLLIVNAGQSYASEVRSADWVHSFTVYFAPQLVADVAAGYAASDDAQLAAPWYTEAAAPWFAEPRHTAPPALHRQLRGLQQALSGGPVTALALEEQLYWLLRQLLGLHQRHVAGAAEQLRAVKRSTRLEICRRLYLARDFIEAQPAEALTLDGIAQVSMLSKNHLLRHFRQLFACSPHQYATQLRLAQARQLLTGSALSVQEISARLGFESPSSFGRLFKAAQQLTPQQYRRHHAA